MNLLDLRGRKLDVALACVIERFDLNWFEEGGDLMATVRVPEYPFSAKFIWYANGGEAVMGDAASEIPFYTTDMNEAWRVHQFMCSHLFSVRRRYYAALQKLTAEKTGGHPVGWPDVLLILKDDMAESICRAALQVLVDLDG